ncbi:NosL protein [Pseudazoarcus pumilus]|uniref:NosL protein n=2 Tax=Pseudazoarcus pumilus TaxID=2067960 RepID=A0A2I6S6X1_9RHOO|nr:NosL protein [Pseudazoarcus pumilus]
MSMNRMMLRTALATAALILLAGCGGADETAMELQARAFHPDDECHVCGMIVTDFSGPKGQAVGRDGTHAFCSTAELIGWWLQPENQVSGARLFVHDMAHGSWEHPDDEQLIDATTAWYVAGTELKGAMGATLASFASEADARALAAEHDGRVLRFDELDASVLQRGGAHGAMH